MIYVPADDSIELMYIESIRTPQAGDFFINSGTISGDILYTELLGEAAQYQV